jgi:molecular chaperone IbpA
VTVFDLSPLFRTAIGFDRVASMLDAAAASRDASYPPYDIEKTGEGAYRLTMAVAGFSPQDLEITLQDGALTIRGKAAREANNSQVLYRGIAGRVFERRFVLADHIVVEGVNLENGLLHVGLKRVVPDALKLRRIEIGGAAQSKQVATETVATEALAA